MEYAGIRKTRVLCLFFPRLESSRFGFFTASISLSKLRFRVSRAVGAVFEPEPEGPEDAPLVDIVVEEVKRRVSIARPYISRRDDMSRARTCQCK